MRVVNILSKSAALLLFLSITGLAMTQISSIRRMFRWSVKVSHPIYLAHLVFVISLGETLMFFGFTSGIWGPLVIYCAIISWAPFDWVFNGRKFSRCQSTGKVRLDQGATSKSQMPSLRREK